MRTKYKFIHFVEIEKKKKTSVWECRNNRSEDVLGYVKWYGPWRQYCFFVDPENLFVGSAYSTQVILSEGCLYDIHSFIKQLRNARNG